MRDHTDPTPAVDDLARGQLEYSPPAVDDVLAEAVAVLRAFTADDTHLSVDDIGTRSGLSSGVALEIVEALVSARLLDPTGTSYRLGTLLFEIGMRASTERGVDRGGNAVPGRPLRANA